LWVSVDLGKDFNYYEPLLPYFSEEGKAAVSREATVVKNGIVG